MKEHKISLGTAILLNMNIMIGSGILIGPGAAAAISGNASFLAWPLVALMFLPIVLCTIELSRMFPGAGGFYLYAKQGLGELAGYTSGWLYIVGYTFAAAVETLALRKTLLVTFGEQWVISSPYLFNALLLIGTVLFSLLSLKIVSNFLNSLTIAKLAPLVILIALLPFIFNPSFSVSGAELALLPASLALPIFGYFGFEYCVGISHLIKDSEKNAPRAIFIGFLGTAILYMLFHFGLLNLMGAERLGAEGATDFASFITLPIPYLRSLLQILIPTASLLTLFAGLLGMINANAILLQTMAAKGLFRGGSLLTPVTKDGRPWAALVLQAIVVFAISTFIPSLSLSAQISLVGALCIFSVFLSFFLPFISLFLVQKERKLHRKIPFTILGIIFLSGFLVYCFTILPHASYVAVIVSAVLVGLGLFTYPKNR